jgi:hypothetical protein
MRGYSNLPENISEKSSKLEIELFLTEHKRLCSFLISRYPWLDFEQADLVASAARMRYIRFAEAKADGGDWEPLDNPEKYRGLLYSRLSAQSASDQRRLLESKAWRCEPVFEIDSDEKEREINVSDKDDPYRNVLARSCESQLPCFFKLLEESALYGYFERLRALAREAGNCSTLSEEYIFIHRYIFESTSENGDPSRALLTQWLNWFPNAKGNAREVAICKLRKKLQKEWSKAKSVVFMKLQHAGGSYDPTPNQYFYKIPLEAVRGTKALMLQGRP